MFESKRFPFAAILPEPEAEGLAELLAYRDSLTELSLTEVRYLSWSDNLSAFRFDTAGLGDDWVVTDLR